LSKHRIIKKEDRTVEIKGAQFSTLEKYLTPIIDRFSIQPEKDYAKYLFGKFNNQKIWYYAINGEMCFTFRESAKYLEMKFDSVRRAFYRQDLIQEKHYFKASSGDIELWDKMSHTSKFTGKSTEIVFLTFLGVWKLLHSFRGEIPSLLYEWFGEKLYEHLKKFQLPKGQFFLTNDSGEIIPQILGDPSKNFVDCRGFRYASKGELLIANILNGLGVRFQYNSPIYFPEELKNILKKKFNCNWSYITADFLIRIVPKTIIEFWGMENDSYYDWKRNVKEFCYKWLKIRLIPIEAHEEQNAPRLKERLRELLNLNKEK